MNFWDETHPLSAESKRLTEQLMPDMGKADTLQGELIRASQRIGYDWFNNGWGCNNWSGAVVFLKRYALELAQKRTAAEKRDFLDALSEVSAYCHGERYDQPDQFATEVVTIIHAFVIQCVHDNPTPIANHIDMLDLTEPTCTWWEEEEGEDEECWDEC